MNLSTHDIGLESIDCLMDIDTLVLFVGQDERPLRGTAGFVDWRLNGALSRILLQGFFTGALGEKLLVPTGQRVPMGRIFAVGLGPLATLGAVRLAEVLESAARMLSAAKVEQAALELPGAGALDDATRAQILRRHFTSLFKGSRLAVFAERELRSQLSDPHQAAG